MDDVIETSAIYTRFAFTCLICKFGDLLNGVCSGVVVTRNIREGERENTTSALPVLVLAVRFDVVILLQDFCLCV